MTTQPSKLVIIITGLSTGGAEMMLLKVLERLDARFAARVISLTTLGEIGPRIQALGIPVEALGMRPGMVSPRAFGRLVSRLREIRPDIVHTWMYHADLIGGLAAKRAGGSAIGWCIRNTNLDRDKTKFTTRAVVRLCARLSRFVPHGILSCSEAARLVHIKVGYEAEKIVVVPNGFDLARFLPDGSARASVRTELGVAADALLIGLIGRFDPLKNHAGFFEAARLLLRRLPEARFVLAGQGIDQDNGALTRAIAAAGVGQATHLLGLRGDVPRLMAALDVLASSSYGEAFPNVLGEAMACGVPCAVTNVGDSAHIVGEAGLVVPSGDMAALATALETLLRMPPGERGALGARARTRVAQHFEIAQVVRHYETHYDDLIAMARPKAKP